MKHIPSLNGLRAISIFIVLFAHLKDTFGFPGILIKLISWTCYGNLGVEVFFVISGFLISTILLSEVKRNDNINFKRFYFRRFLRIFPVFFLYVIFILFLNNIYNLTILDFIKPLFYFSNFAVFGGHWFLGHTWSLSVEEQFYLIWPFTIYKFKKYIPQITLTVFFLAIILRLIGLFNQEYSDFILNPLIGSLDGILIGSYISLLIIGGKIPKFYGYYKSFKYPVLYTTISLLLLYSLQHLGNIGYTLFILFKGFGSILIAFFLIYCIQEKESLIYRFLNLKFISYIGILSYSIYIWQQFFLLKIGATKQIFFFQKYPLNILFVFIIAILSYELFEKPILKLKNNN
jgi:peptidoglycan/LPS O-acetylase OafA/YrhL